MHRTRTCHTVRWSALKVSPAMTDGLGLNRDMLRTRIATQSGPRLVKADGDLSVPGAIVVRMRAAKQFGDQELRLGRGSPSPEDSNAVCARARPSRHQPLPAQLQSLARALTEAPGAGLAEGKIGRGPARGRSIQVDMASDERRLIAGTYEPWIHSLLPQILRDGMSMWDVGAHIGYYVITGCALSPTGHHLAVEPDPTNVERLRHNRGSTA